MLHFTPLGFKKAEKRVQCTPMKYSVLRRSQQAGPQKTVARVRLIAPSTWVHPISLLCHPWGPDIPFRLGLFSGARPLWWIGWNVVLTFEDFLWSLSFWLTQQRLWCQWYIRDKRKQKNTTCTSSTALVNIMKCIPQWHVCILVPTQVWHTPKGTIHFYTWVQVVCNKYFLYSFSRSTNQYKKWKNQPYFWKKKYLHLVFIELENNIASQYNVLDFKTLFFSFKKQKSINAQSNKTGCILRHLK